MGLQQFERRLERLVEGAFAKAFRSGLQPVELGRRLTREMDLQRTVGVNGLMALLQSNSEADCLARQLGRNSGARSNTGGDGAVTARAV